MRMLHGERYAKTINASFFAPACGSVTKELVRKQLEIPGCKSCLITERSPALEAAGFVDMENCVLADESDVLEKLEYLFDHEDLLTSITERGHELVHARHTMQQRDQVFQWFQLTGTLVPDQRIIQSDPFSPLRVVERSSKVANGHLSANGLHLVHFREGERFFAARRYPEAQRAYSKCLGYLSEFPEAKLKLALCDIYNGNPTGALSWIVQPIQCTLAGYDAEDPDPIEWAYLIICLLCAGRLRSAVKRAGQFPWVRHRELDRARCAVAVIARDVDAPPAPPAPPVQGQLDRSSVHSLQDRDFEPWIEELCVMLQRCGQRAFAQMLRAYRPLEIHDAPRATSEGWHPPRVHARSACGNHGVWSSLRPKPTLRRLDNPELWRRLKETLHGRISSIRQQLVTRLLKATPADQ
jgi:hypothetical protein